MQSRLINNQYNKCTKDYYRLNFVKKISEIKFDYEKIINSNDKIFFEKFINKSNLIYKKDNPNLFKLPFNICSLENKDDEKKELHAIYDKFINLDINIQYDIFAKSNFLSTSEKEIIKNIFTRPS